MPDQRGHTNHYCHCLAATPYRMGCEALRVAHFTIGARSVYGKGGCRWGVSPPWLQCGEAGAIELFMSDLDFWVGHLDCCKARSRQVHLLLCVDVPH